MGQIPENLCGQHTKTGEIGKVLPENPADDYI